VCVRELERTERLVAGAIVTRHSPVHQSTTPHAVSPDMQRKPTMTRPDFEDLPFFERPDLTPYLLHLTRNTRHTDDYSAFDNLVSILKTGEICASSSKNGFIKKGPHGATCFMDVPFYSLKYVLNEDNADPDDPRYEPFGVFVTKKYAYRHGCRPVLYLANEELKRLRIPPDELWRVVRLEVNDDGWISWLHEREWRCKDNFALPSEPIGVLVRNSRDAQQLQQQIVASPSDFKVKPRTVIPLTVLCQGLPKL
jgi:hypothetical protein